MRHVHAGRTKTGAAAPQKALQPLLSSQGDKLDYFPCFSMIAACAAARRAIGTRNGEQDT